MQQPFTNSEAVRRCMTIPDGPIPGVRSYEPRPPYGTGVGGNVRSRPYSAPSRRITTGNHAEPWRSPVYKEPHIPIPKHYMTKLAENAAPNAPYAARRNYSYMNSTIFNNAPSDSRCTVPLPPYDPMNDPHLLEYFERRFGNIQRTSKRNIWNRPSSASPAFRSHSGDSFRKRRNTDDSDKSVLYKVAVTTGDKKGCGTDSKVFITMKGTKGKVKKHRLTKKAGSVKSHKDVAFRFAKGSTHLFKVKGPEIGELKSINIETNAKTKEEAWFLQEVEIEHVKKKKRWVFIVNKWFSLYHSDQQLCRELYPMVSSNTTYEILVVTGDKTGAGTNANVFVTIFGKSGITQKISLKKEGKSEFKPNSSAIFKTKANCVGPMRKIRLEHDNTGIMPGWFVERVVVTDLKNRHWRYFFPCGEWLSRTESDGKISRDLVGSKDEFALRKDYKYNVTIFTGDKPGAGTDATVYITLFGEMGDSGENFLKKSFKRNSKNAFVLKCPCVGRIDRLRIGHDNSGFKAGWYLDKVIVDDCQNNIVYEFPCYRWFATDEDDGQISRDLLVGVGATTSAPGIPYRITVSTGDERNGGTDARVFIILHAGKDGKEKTSGKIWLDNGSFERNKTDIFDIDVATLLSPVSKIEIGHDNKGLGPGWFLDRVVVLCYATGIEQVFLCGKWLATDQEDGLIQRTLYEQKAVRKQREKKTPWNIWMYTSDISLAGTDANVYICVYGEKGKSDEILLENKTDNFERGKVDYFKRNIIDIGKPYKIRVWHDKSGAFSGWHLNKVEMEEMLTKNRYLFNCDRWLADDEDDHECVREMPATGPNIDRPLPLVFYIVEVYTGSVRYAGTDANVFINIFGELGDTGQRWLKHPVSSNINKFEKGQRPEKVGERACFETSSKDVFKIEAVTLMALKKIIIGHDAKNPGSGWFLDKVIVKQEGNSKYDQTFTCERWLDADEDDGQVVREITASGVQLLATTTYNVFVKTGDVSGAGTDANVNIKIFGSKNDTGDLKLRTTENTSNKFEKGRTDHFKLEASDIGKIKKIKIGHDNSKPFASWFLDEVRIDIPSRGEQYVFACHRWLGKDSEDGNSEIEIEPSFKEDREKRIPYEVTIWTSDISKAGTDSNVFLQIYGVDGKTEKNQLRNRSDNFERAQKDVFKIEALDVGQIVKVRIGHDGKKFMSGWHLNKVLIRRRPRAGTKKRRKKGQSEQKRRQEILSEMSGNQDDSDSDSSSSSSPRRRKSSARKIRKPSLKKIEEEEDVYDGEETEDYWFFVNRWFDKSEDDKAIERELMPTDEKGNPLHTLEEVQYTVKVYTGKTSGAGTDANVFINLYGEKHDSGERQLKDSADNINKFETGCLDTFQLMAVDLGKLVKLKVRHDNKGVGAAWYLDKIEVEDSKRKKIYYFLCQKWLAVGKDDGQISRELIPVDKSVLEKSGKSGKKDSARQDVALEIKAAMTTYYTKVVTGTVSGAGTDANVYIILYGEKDHTDKMFLKSSMTYKNKFENGQTDEFILEAVNIGKLLKIKIGHDNSGMFGAAWFLDKVIIDAPSLGCSWTFPCNKWLADNKDDCQLERELFPQDLETVEYNPCVPYEVKTYTADERGAGTSANVYIQLYGKEIITEEIPLCNKRDRDGKFKRGKMDLFTVEMEDVGDSIDKMRIWHDNEGLTAGWKLDKVEIRKLHDSGKGSSLQGSDTYVFQCGRWLARDEDDYSISRELIPDKKLQEIMTSSGQAKVKEVKLRDKLTKKVYEVSVFTGDESGAGTDANVFLNIIGENGDAGERKLHKSETYMDKFEKNHCDIFKIEAADLGKLYKVKVRHDNSSFFKSAWYLSKIEIKDPKDNEVYVFYCERWLAKNKDDGKIERSLYVKGYTGDMGSSTGSINTMKYGSNLSLDSMKSSKSPRMSRKQMSMASSIVGIPEGEQPVTYNVSVATGDGEDNGTTSNIYIDICGPKNRHTGKLFLDLTGKDRFEPGSTESFSLEGLDVDEVRKIKVGHDGTAPGTGWFVKSITIDIPVKGKNYLFSCCTWLARDKSDGKTERTFALDDGVSTITSYKPMIPYECTIITGDKDKAGTDMQITITLFGTGGTSSPTILEKGGNRFERGNEDLMKLDMEDVGPLKKMRVETSGKGSRPSWFLEKIALMNMKTGEKTNFICDDWFSKEKGHTLVKDIPAKIRGREVLDKTSYKINVKTSNVRGAGTDANVFVILFGANGDTGQLHLEKSETYKDPFENDQIDEFTFKDMLSVGEMSKCRVWHDNKGLGAAWHLAYIEVEDLKARKTYKFHCDKWLSTKEDDKQIVRELTCGTSSAPRSPGSKEMINYELEVETSNIDEAGTMHHGWVYIEGERGNKKYKMHNSKMDKKLRKGTTNTFTFSCKHLGKLRNITVGACEREDIQLGNAYGKKAQWLCKKISITDTVTGDKYVFPVSTWIPISEEAYDLGDGKKVKVKSVEKGQIAVVRNLAAIKYEVIVYTGDVSGAGTNANVWITVFGEHGDSGKRPLKQSFRNLLEKNQMDKFTVECLDLGELTKVRMEHDNSGFRPGWFLEKVEIVNQATSATSVFPCQQWLDKDKDDGQIVRDILVSC